MFFVKTLVAACLISFASWLAGRKPELAGFLIALPVTTLIALAFSYVEHRDPEASVAFAKSVFVGIPVSLLFFVPFLFASKLNLHFIALYILGLVMLVIGYFLHKYIVGLI